MHWVCCVPGSAGSRAKAEVVGRANKTRAAQAVSFRERFISFISEDWCEKRQPGGPMLIWVEGSGSDAFDRQGCPNRLLDDLEALGEEFHRDSQRRQDLDHLVIGTRGLDDQAVGEATT